MPKLLKDLYTKKLIEELADNIHTEYALFDKDAFVKAVFSSDWKDRELKARMSHIATVMHTFLPDEFSLAVVILKKVILNYSGFEYMFFPDYIEKYGLDEFELSTDALIYFTEYASSEFAVRPFIIKYKSRMMEKMGQWAKSENPHHRRLASEGCRPRLPWAISLPLYKSNPSAILPILEELKNDDSEYVRRSVANNLNDISKDNPTTVVTIAKSWFDNGSTNKKLIKHGCRTLLKDANPEILTLFGFQNPTNISVAQLQLTPVVSLGEKLSFSFEISSTEKMLGKLRVEFAICFMKNNGKKSRKLFKVSEGEYKTNTKAVRKEFSFRPISTRKYYTGEHDLIIVINGVEKAKCPFVVEN